MQHNLIIKLIKIKKTNMNKINNKLIIQKFYQIKIIRKNLKNYGKSIKIYSELLIY